MPVPIFPSCPPISCFVFVYGGWVQHTKEQEAPFDNYACNWFLQHVSVSFHYVKGVGIWYYKAEIHWFLPLGSVHKESLKQAILLKATKFADNLLESFL